MLFKELANVMTDSRRVSSRLKMIDILTETLKDAEADEIEAVIYITQGVLAPPFDAVEFGVAEKIVEDALSVATGHDKEKVEKEFRKSGTWGWPRRSSRARPG